MQDGTTGPHDVELAGGALLTVPWSKPLQRHVGLLLAGTDKPQSPGRCQEQPQGIRAHNMLVLPTLVLRDPIIGLAITDIDFEGPAIVIRLQEGRHSQADIRTKKGFQRFETPKGFGAEGALAVCTLRPPDDDHPDGPSGSDAVPEPHPGLDDRPGFLRLRLPPGCRHGQGFGRANQGTFFAPCPPLAFDTRGRQLIEFGGE